MTYPMETTLTATEDPVFVQLRDLAVDGHERQGAGPARQPRPDRDRGVTPARPPGTEFTEALFRLPGGPRTGTGPDPETESAVQDEIGLTPGEPGRARVAQRHDDAAALEHVGDRRGVAGILDEVVVRLESPGGLVHGYGLAASQLARITQKKIPLTVCVDKVAASGGYMMACVADKIVAAPFAVLGSIGVVAQLPNFNRALKKHDVDYEIFTAGEYKRTVTMLGENTEKGRRKFMEDLEDTHVLFKEFVGEHRPAVNVDEVATGEIWFGRRALEKNLIDLISTSDEYLTAMHPQADIVGVRYEHKKRIQERVGLAAARAFETAFDHTLARLARRHWF